jgi:ribosomal 50S subunit-recycling heat shock protein
MSGAPRNGNAGANGKGTRGKSDGPDATLRIDKWLWHARFFKSRSLANAMVAAGRLRVNSQPISKPHHQVRPGDVLTFPQARRIRVIEIAAIGTRRGPRPAGAAQEEGWGGRGQTRRTRARRGPPDQEGTARDRQVKGVRRWYEPRRHLDRKFQFFLLIRRFRLLSGRCNISMVNRVSAKGEKQRWIWAYRGEPLWFAHRAGDSARPARWRWPVKG